MCRSRHHRRSARLGIGFARHECGEQAIGHLGVAIRGRDGRVLLAFDDEPAAIAGIAQNGDHRGEIDRAFSRRAEGAVEDGIEEAPAAIARHPRHGRAHILAMDVTDARDVLLEFRRRIAAGEGDMAGIVQQADLGTGDPQQMVDVLGGLDIGAHVVMVRETNAAGERVPRQRRDALAIR